MRADKIGIVVSRGIGLGLILLGGSSAAGHLIFFEPSAWTSYSPLATKAATPMLDPYIMGLWIPSVAQLILGSALILFSQRVGVWLGHGLNESEQSANFSTDN